MPSLLKTVCAQKLEASLYQYQFIEELHLYFGLFFHIIIYYIFEPHMLLGEIYDQL